MSVRNLQTEIDRLYQLPPEEFTAARNELAKQLQGDEARTVKALKKPNLPAWAVNQLYWTSPDTHESLMKAADDLRRAHRQVIAGHPAELREVSAAHRDALKKAVAKVHEIIRLSNHDINADMTRAVIQTLEALPGDDHPGRLDRPLVSEGFEALMNVAASPRGRSESAAAAVGARAAGTAKTVSPRTTRAGKPGLTWIAGTAKPVQPAGRAKSRARDSAAEIRESERAAVRARALARREARKNLRKAERALAAARKLELAARQTARLLSKQLESARRREERAQQDLEGAREARIALEEKETLGKTAANRAAAEVVGLERTVETARNAAKSTR